MLLTKEVEVKVTWKTKDYYEKLGYILPKNNKGKVSSKIPIIVKIEDLPLKSNILINLVCDYCEKEFSRRFADHIFIKNKNCIDKDACKECASLKYKENYILENGVENPFQLDSIKEKIKISNNEKYGVDNPMYSDEIKNKLKISCIDKYGVDNPSKNENIKQKIINTMQERFGVDNIMELKEYRLKIAETLSKNQSVSTSKQQIYIHKLYGGILNYSVSTPILDIAFPKEMIYVEYNGGGHDLSVKLGSYTEEEFKQKELRRYHYLKDKNWKAIFIDSNNDMLPSDIKFKEILNIAKAYLNTGEKWIKFDITNKKIKFKHTSLIYNFGKLRKIKEKDLEEVN